MTVYVNETHGEDKQQVTNLYFQKHVLDGHTVKCENS